MQQVRTIDRVVQRADYYETDTGRELRLRAAAELTVCTERVVSDGGTAATETIRTDSERPPYTRHIEPPEQGGKAYIRCRYCKRELLVELGGQDKLPHAPGCPEGES
ncbi:hypothetical protein [Natrononativus amylolyticus]|uniref:hypothetical protein n=1 Tax=Natrononativus amylolyticus TaxID=2963434 RepID=UPI0020CBBDDB|nr:hypothetical protein [Natrononativus amylolyticus]